MPKFTPVLAATTVIAGIISIYLWQQLRDEREKTALLQQRVTKLELVQARPAPIAPVLAMQQTDGEKPAADTTAVEKGAKPDVAAARAAARNNIRELLQDPSFREGMAPALRAALARNFPDLAKELNLTPEQADKLLDVISKYQMASLGNALGGGVGGADRRDLQATVQENDRKRDAEINSLLGDAKYQQWKDYEGSLPARQQVSRLSQTVASSGQPLGQQQEKQLIAALAADQKRQADQTRQAAPLAASSTPRDPMAMLQENMQRTEENNRRTLEVASSYLNAQQLEALRNQQNQQQRIGNMLLNAQRARAGATERPRE